MVGGIHTVLSTKAQTLVERFGDEYVAIGPWLLSEVENDIAFVDEPGFEAFSEACRQMGIPIRVGRWQIPGSPRTILVEFSGLYDKKDEILGELWDTYEVDSISGGWDYVEPVLFGHAAGRVIEKWWDEYLAPFHRRAVVQAHEWMTGSALLYLKSRTPSVGTIFTTHATMLGRALSSVSCSPDDGLGDQTPAELAETHGVVAKHSLEGVCAREADVFTTVSEITAREAELLHQRAPEPLLFNGIDLEVIDALAGKTSREQAREVLMNLASKVAGEDVSEAVMLGISGRYEFHNKGMDVLLEAAARLDEVEGRRVVVFVLVPAGNSGPREEILDRMSRPLDELDGPAGIVTHNLFDEEKDPVLSHCRSIGLENEPGSRVKVIQIPVYMSETDGFLNMPYLAVLRAMDLTAFPSYYEPWGYTPQESIAVGVPTLTTDYAGFGRWAQGEKLGPADGVHLLSRVHVEYADVVDRLTEMLEVMIAEERRPDALTKACRATAERTAWSGFIQNYERAFDAALTSVQDRMARGVPVSRRPRVTIDVSSNDEGHRPHLLPFEVAATLPRSLRGLERLARNFWWSWDPDAVELFEELSPDAWEGSGHNPVGLLRQVSPEDVAARGEDKAYVARLEAVLKRFDAYMSEPEEPVVVSSDDSITSEHPIAYLCAEFGIHESLRIYSGGLGILAGDHLKSASDLNLPFLAIGLFYRMGYVHQKVTADGDQLAADRTNDPRSLPVEPVLDRDGRSLKLKLGMPGRELHLAAWRVRVGRISLYLLDANLPENRPEDRDITRNLYGGDPEMRIRQEIVLGRGGSRLLRELGIQPSAYHINEGHAAFLMLERVSYLVRQRGLTFEEAREFVRATTAFTTHTPVPAGHDRFSEDLMRRYFSDVETWLGVPWERFYGLGHTDSDQADFNMTYLAMNFSSYRNGVSRLHGVASRKLLHSFWPGLLESEVPIGSITNGVHLASWADADLGRALGAEHRAVRPADFAKAEKLDAAKLWEIHTAAKKRLARRVRANLEKSFLERDDSPFLLDRMLEGVDEDALTIGFARRFAPYKRAHLLFQDLDKLKALLDGADRPVRILIAGKAHPNDQAGKDILREIFGKAREDLVGRVFFLEDYDIDLARDLVQGADIWLNTPTRMLEASGTSGMKAAANGCLNLSIGDGWWPEAFDGSNGWLISGERVYADQELQNQLDATTLYRLLEEEIVPSFYERDAAGVPERWIRLMRGSLATVPAQFNTDRMVGEYASNAYRELGRGYFDLSPEAKSGAKSLAHQKARIRQAFPGVRFVSVQVADLSGLRMGDSIDAQLQIDLGSLTPDDVVVELVLGNSADALDLHNLGRADLKHVSNEGSVHTYEGGHEIRRSGSYAYGIRVRAQLASDPEALGDLVLWA